MKGQRAVRTFRVCSVSGSLFVLSWWIAVAAGLPTREEILELVYPEAVVRAETVFLTPDQKERASEIAGEELPSALIARYVAMRNDQVIGRAYVDTHVVRSKRESLLICLEEDGRVRRIEVTAFLEPPEFQASPAWYRQYQGERLHDNLRLDRKIRTITGATLTAMAANRAVRRVLAIDRVLMESAAEGIAR